MTAPHKPLSFIVTTLAGNVIEWYDFALYGFFASVIAQLFFPTSSPSSALLFTFGVFALGFLTRPIGGVLFGLIGDKWGRKASLLLSIVLIIFPTFLIGLLPSYQSLGFMAPLLLMLLRITQGMAVSGELAGGAIFLLENVAADKRALYCSYIMCSTYVGLALGALAGLLVFYIYSQQQILNFAWRLPFLLSLPLGLAAILMRFNCQESGVFQKLVINKQRSKAPFKDIINYFPYQLVLTLLLSSNLAVAIYILIAYFPVYFENNCHLSSEQSVLICGFGLICLTVFVLSVGLLARGFQRHVLFFLTGPLSFLCFGHIIFKLLESGIFIHILMAVVLMSLFLAPIAAILFLLLMTLFPSHLRCTGISTGYNLSMTLFGGTIPFALQWSMTIFNTQRAPLFCIYFCSLLTLTALVLFCKNENASIEF